MGNKGAAPRGKAEVPATTHRRPKASASKVAPGLVRPFALPSHEHSVVELLGGAERLDQAAALGATPSRALLGKLDARTVGEVADRVREVQVLSALHV